MSRFVRDDLQRAALSGRRGLSLVEIAITVAIFGILAAIGASMLNDLVPSWRTKRAAEQFAADISTARHRAIAERVEYRVRLGSYDSSLDGTGPSTGSYYVERGDRASNSASWDILPVDLDGSGTQTAEGTVDISIGGQDELAGVSIQEWDAANGTIIFSPHGWVTNAVGDFDSRGYIEVTFVNKYSRRQGDTDEWTAVISRGGLVRLEPTSGTPIGNANGTSVNSWLGGNTGYVGGSGGGSGSGAI